MMFLFQKRLPMGARSPDPRESTRGRWRAHCSVLPITGLGMRLWPQQGDSGANLATQTGLPHFLTGPCGSPAQTCNPPGTGLDTFLLVCLLVPRSRAFPLSWAKVLRGRGWNVTWLMNHLLLAGGHSRPAFSLLSPLPSLPFQGGRMDMSP